MKCLSPSAFCIFSTIFCTHVIILGSDTRINNKVYIKFLPPFLTRFLLLLNKIKFFFLYVEIEFSTVFDNLSYLFYLGGVCFGLF